MFNLTVTHISVEDGVVYPPSYSNSPDAWIICVTNNPNGTKIHVRFSAHSEQYVSGIRFTIYKYNEETHIYDFVTNGVKLGPTNEEGKLVWHKDVVFEKINGKPIILDLTDLSYANPLKLIVVAGEKTGRTKTIEAIYFPFPDLVIR
jgi:hypothetical protein